MTKSVHLERGRKYVGFKGPPSKEIAKRKDDFERKRSTDAADAKIEADNKIADAAVEKARQRARDRADKIVDRYMISGASAENRTAEMQKSIERLASTTFGRHALLEACKKKGIDIETYAEMLEISAEIGRVTGHADSVASRRHVTKSLENLHEVTQKENLDRQTPIINIIISAPFRDVANPRNTGYTVVDGESETPAEGD